MQTKLKLGDRVIVKLKGTITSVTSVENDETYPTVEICLDKTVNRSRFLYTCSKEGIICEVVDRKKETEKNS